MVVLRSDAAGGSAARSVSPIRLSTHATPAARRGQQALPPLAEIPAKGWL